MNQSMYVETGPHPCRYCDEEVHPTKYTDHLMDEHRRQYLRDTGEALRKGLAMLAGGEDDDD